MLDGDTGVVALLEKASVVDVTFDPGSIVELDVEAEVELTVGTDTTISGEELLELIVTVAFGVETSVVLAKRVVLELTAEVVGLTELTVVVETLLNGEIAGVVLFD